MSPSSSPRPARKGSASPSPKPTRTRAHRPKPAPAPSPRYAFAVSYSLVRSWHGGFEGEFVITNRGAAPLGNWELTASLPGDHIRSVTGASYRTHGETLILTPESGQSIAPGASLAVLFTAGGSATSPANCTFNGQGC